MGPLAFSFASLCAAPLLLFPAAVVIESYCIGPSADVLQRKWKKNALRLFLSLLCTFIAVVGADQIEVFISVLGALTCVPLAFIYPSLLHLRVCAETNFQKFTDVLIMFAGFIVLSSPAWSPFRLLCKISIEHLEWGVLYFDLFGICSSFMRCGRLHHTAPQS